MTAKHRKGRGNNKQEENSFKHEAPERDPRRGGAPAILSVLLLTVLIGGAIVAWFCIQQHQTSANLADTLVGMQMKMVKLQALQEEVRMTADKVNISSSAPNAEIQNPCMTGPNGYYLRQISPSELT